MRLQRHLVLIVLCASIGASPSASAAEGGNARYQLARASLAITKSMAKKLVVKASAEQRAPAALLKLERVLIHKANKIVEPMKGLALPFSEVKAEAREDNGHTMISTPLGAFSASGRGMALRVDRDARGKALKVPYAEQIRLDLHAGAAYYKRESYPEQRIVLDETIHFHTVVPVKGRRHPLATRELGKLLGSDVVVGTTLVRRSRRGDSAETIELWHPDAVGKHQRVEVAPEKHETLTTLWNYINQTL